MKSKPKRKPQSKRPTGYIETPGPVTLQALPSERDDASRGRVIIPAPPNEAGASAFYQPTPFHLRFWGWLGFHAAHAPRPETPDFTEGFAEGWFIVATVGMLDWKDRVRALISGKIMVEQAVKTDIAIGNSRSTSALTVLPPSWRPSSVYRPPPIATLTREELKARAEAAVRENGNRN